MKRKLFATISPVVALLALAACSADPPPPVVASDPSTVTVTTTQAPTTGETTETSLQIPRVVCTEGGVNPSTWDIADDTAPRNMVTGEIVDIRTGQHRCFDQVTFDVDTSEKVGFSVRYVDVVTQDGSGFPVAVAGNAALQVVIDAPAYTVLDGFRGNWPALQEVKYAGSFEGMTTIAVGVREKTPFAVEHAANGDTMRVVLYLAHEK